VVRQKEKGKRKKAKGKNLLEKDKEHMEQGTWNNNIGKSHSSLSYYLI